jgi:hypothetical protein
MMPSSHLKHFVQPFEALVVLRVWARNQLTPQVALPLTGPLPGVYNLISVGGALEIGIPQPPRLRESKLQPIGTACRKIP